MIKRETLAAVAEAFAAKRVSGEKSNADYLKMLKYYPENDPDEFKNGWCCAFVYHCCRETGFELPLGTHKTARKGHFRWFTSVIAWLEWAQVNGFLGYENFGFVPQRGDIVIYNNIIPEPRKQEGSLWCDHAGIVLSCDGDTLTVAEGNVDNQNVSGIMARKRDNTIGCYIRIPENYMSDEFIALPENIYFIWGSGKTTAANELTASMIAMSIIQTTTAPNIFQTPTPPFTKRSAGMYRTTGHLLQRMPVSGSATLCVR